MEEITNKIAVIEEYIFRRKNIKVTINQQQFKNPDIFQLSHAISLLDEAYTRAKVWLDENPLN